MTMISWRWQHFKNFLLDSDDWLHIIMGDRTLLLDELFLFMFFTCMLDCVSYTSDFGGIWAGTWNLKMCASDLTSSTGWVRLLHFCTFEPGAYIHTEQTVTEPCRMDRSCTTSWLFRAILHHVLQLVVITKACHSLNAISLQQWTIIQSNAADIHRTVTNSWSLRRGANIMQLPTLRKSFPPTMAVMTTANLLTLRKSFSLTKVAVIMVVTLPASL